MRKSSGGWILGGVIVVALVVVGGIVYSQHGAKNQEASLINLPKAAMQNANLGSANSPRTAAPACGSSNGETLSSAPTAGLCSPGTATAVVANSNGWAWTCSENGSAVKCGATAAAVKGQTCAYVTDDDYFGTPPKPTVKVFTLAGTPVRQWSLKSQYPVGVTVDSSGSVYVAGGGLQAPWIQKYSLFGAPIGIPWTAGLINPTWIKASSTGNVYVTDGYLLHSNEYVKEYTPSGALVAQFGAGAAFYLGLGFDALNNVYVSDSYSGKIYTYSPSGSLLNQWGNFGTYNPPLRVAKNPLNNDLYIMTSYPGAEIREYTTTGTFVSQLNFNYAIEDFSVDPSGNIYILDSNDSLIKKYNPSGSLLTQWSVDRTMMGIAIGRCN
jgi:hypothetical protein